MTVDFLQPQFSGQGYLLSKFTVVSLSPVLTHTPSHTHTQIERNKGARTAPQYQIVTNCSGVLPRERRIHETGRNERWKWRIKSEGGDRRERDSLRDDDKEEKMKVNGVHFVFVPKHSRDRTLFAIK